MKIVAICLDFPLIETFDGINTVQSKHLISEHYNKLTKKYGRLQMHYVTYDRLVKNTNANDIINVVADEIWKKDGFVFDEGMYD